ncbi:hypothetical protein JD844_001820 [Phrynosoma platyrhinos]|uniref:Uncharacterized protein n=1 Tax=Phrynosoma platyrhinos TaxID=52577 RepID=A0ABQ7TAL1_PHRPL|nr:hypothetical protein JD844_001820 [Phrynosoma platyrhinos]
MVWNELEQKEWQIMASLAGRYRTIALEPFFGYGKCLSQENVDWAVSRGARKQFWETYPHNGKGGTRTPGVDVAGLVAGLIAALVSTVMFVVVAMYCVKYRAKERRRSRTQDNLYPEVPLANFDEEPKPEMAPGLPSYEQAMASSGVHDAPPPPYNSVAGENLTGVSVYKSEKILALGFTPEKKLATEYQMVPDDCD